MSLNPLLTHAFPSKFLRSGTPLLWLNPEFRLDDTALDFPLNPLDAEERFERLAPEMAKIFPQLLFTKGRVESELRSVSKLQAAMQAEPIPGWTSNETFSSQGQWWIKRDDALPVAGSIKARGGFHEVLALAEKLAHKHGIQSTQAGACISTRQAKAIFARYTVAVGSTGNLGLSIGLIAAALGFQSVVHMSRDAKEWKKERLRRGGIRVEEHSGDYAAAVSAGRKKAAEDPMTHFVDDEHSSLLFLGYSAAAQELAHQLTNEGIVVDADHPLFVYLPCGVGGAPGGIAYGLKRIFGSNVHCFFAEPTSSPCMLVQMAAGNTPTSVYTIGLSNRTEADGLAVAQASMLVAPIMRRILSGVFLVDDDTLLRDTYLASQIEGIEIEPSAAASFRGPAWLQQSDSGQSYLQRHNLSDTMRNSTHVLWSTGGSLVPADERARFLARGQAIFKQSKASQTDAQKSQGQAETAKLPSQGLP